jgi:hypothetical protein
MAEKGDVLAQEDTEFSTDSNSQDDPSFGYSPAEQRKIIHKIDRRLVVLLGFMYCVSLMDRSNLSNAKVAG